MVSNKTIPADFQEVLEHADLWESFTTMPPSHQREYLEAIQEAKKTETRAKRIQQAVKMIALYQHSRDSLY